MTSQYLYIHGNLAFWTGSQAGTPQLPGNCQFTSSASSFNLTLHPDFVNTLPVCNAAQSKLVGLFQINVRGGGVAPSSAALNMKGTLYGTDWFTVRTVMLPSAATGAQGHMVRMDFASFVINANTRLIVDSYMHFDRTEFQGSGQFYASGPSMDSAVVFEGDISGANQYDPTLTMCTLDARLLSCSLLYLSVRKADCTVLCVCFPLHCGVPRSIDVPENQWITIEASAFAQMFPFMVVSGAVRIDNIEGATGLVSVNIAKLHMAGVGDFIFNSTDRNGAGLTLTLTVALGEHLRGDWAMAAFPNHFRTVVIDMQTGSIDNGDVLAWRGDGTSDSTVFFGGSWTYLGPNSGLVLSCPACTAATSTKWVLAGNVLANQNVIPDATSINVQSGAVLILSSAVLQVRVQATSASNVTIDMQQSSLFWMRALTLGSNSLTVTSSSTTRDPIKQLNVTLGRLSITTGATVLLQAPYNLTMYVVSAANLPGNFLAAPYDSLTVHRFVLSDNVTHTGGGAISVRRIRPYGIAAWRSSTITTGSIGFGGGVTIESGSVLHSGALLTIGDGSLFPVTIQGGVSINAPITLTQSAACTLTLKHLALTILLTHFCSLVFVFVGQIASYALTC